MKGDLSNETLWFKTSFGLMLTWYYINTDSALEAHPVESATDWNSTSLLLTACLTICDTGTKMCCVFLKLSNVCASCTVVEDSTDALLESPCILNAQLHWLFVHDDHSSRGKHSTGHCRLLCRNEGMLSPWGEMVTLHSVDLLLCPYIGEIFCFHMYLEWQNCIYIILGSMFRAINCVPLCVAHNNAITSFVCSFC